MTNTRENERDGERLRGRLGLDRTKKAPVRCEDESEMGEHLVLESI